MGTRSGGESWAIRRVFYKLVASGGRANGDDGFVCAEAIHAPLPGRDPAATREIGRDVKANPNKIVGALRRGEEEGWTSLDDV